MEAIKVPNNGCECKKGDPDWVCDMHLRAGKGEVFDDVADHKDNRIVQRSNGRYYGTSPKDRTSKRQAVSVSSELED